MSKLDNFLYNEHGLILTESELNDVLELARQEIELPTVDEALEEVYTPEYAWSKETEGWVIATAKWFIDKVRNPYPKQINP
jgi:hypothetical protein